MATSVVPALIDALVTQATAALPTATVFDGTGVTNQPGDYLMVGVEDPDSDAESTAATTSEVPGPIATTRPRDETGEVVLLAHSWNGDGNAKTARDAVYALAAAVANLCRATPGLGVTGLLWTGYGSATQLVQNQDSNGARAYLVFRISFRARI